MVPATAKKVLTIVVSIGSVGPEQLRQTCLCGKQHAQLYAYAKTDPEPEATELELLGAVEAVTSLGLDLLHEQGRILSNESGVLVATRAARVDDAGIIDGAVPVPVGKPC